jgi:hypothetical protein
LDRVLGPLHVLEERFRPLVRGIPSGLQPATTFRVSGELGE